MKDEFKFNAPTIATERFVTTTKPIVDGNKVTLDDTVLVGSKNSVLKVVEVPYSAQFPDENGSYDQICYCLDYTLYQGETDFELKITFNK
jgi:hypothetical protein